MKNKGVNKKGASILGDYKKTTTPAKAPVAKAKPAPAKATKKK